MIVFKHPKRFMRRILHPQRYPWGAILMFHRIDNIDHEKLWYNEHLKVSPEFLENFIRCSQKRHLSFVSLDEMSELIRSGKKQRHIVSLTLDDGYKDNFTNGLPVFKIFNIPFCIYVATRLPEKQMTYWWYLIEDIILQQNDTVILNNGMSFPCKTKEEKESAFLSVREEVLKLPQDNFDSEFEKLLSNYPIDLYAYNDQLPLTWEMISELGCEPLATIGCHTHSHLSMYGCTKEMIIDDIILAQELMQKNAGIKMHHFAYPFGDDIAVKDYHRSIVEELNFDTIATTNEGFVSGHTDLHQLPRLFVTERNAEDVIDSICYAC